jgi:hypothetical protein
MHCCAEERERVDQQHTNQKTESVDRSKTRDGRTSTHNNTSSCSAGGDSCVCACVCVRWMDRSLAPTSHNANNNNQLTTTTNKQQTKRRQRKEKDAVVVQSRLNQYSQAATSKLVLLLQWENSSATPRNASGNGQVVYLIASLALAQSLCPLLSLLCHRCPSRSPRRCSRVACLLFDTWPPQAAHLFLSNGRYASK